MEVDATFRPEGLRAEVDDRENLLPALHHSVLVASSTPLNADKFRLLMASQVVKAVKGEQQDWARHDLICTFFY